MSIKNIFSALLIVVLFLIATAGSSATPSTDFSPADKMFVNDAAQVNLSEIKLGKLARDRGLNPAIKSFGSKMMADHSAANQKLRSIIAPKDLELPEAQAPDRSQLYENLATLFGAEFDEAFTEHMVRGHQSAIAKFEQQERAGQNQELKNYARSTLPTLKEHLRIATSL